MGDRWRLMSVPVAKVSPSHAVEPGRRVPRRWADAPIHVIERRGLLGGVSYRIHDGNARLAAAKAAGHRMIAAYVRAAR